MEIRHVPKTNMNFRLDFFAFAYAKLDENWKGSNVNAFFSRLYYVKSGTGFIEYDNKRIELHGGKVYFIPAGCVCSFGCETLEKIYLHFCATTIEKYDILAKAEGVYSLDFSKEDWDKLYEYAFSEDYIDFIKMKTMIYETVQSFIEKIPMKNTCVKQYSDLVQNSMKYIHDNMRINLTTREIAENLYVSESKLRKKFSSEMGISIGKYIDELVLLAAKERLADKSYDISTISDELGFCDTFYFSRRFKKAFGRTPNQYRREIILM